jgi:hypothetical protein
VRFTSTTAVLEKAIIKSMHPTMKATKTGVLVSAPSAGELVTFNVYTEFPPRSKVKVLEAALNLNTQTVNLTAINSKNRRTKGGGLFDVPCSALIEVVEARRNAGAAASLAGGYMLGKHGKTIIKVLQLYFKPRDKTVNLTTLNSRNRQSSGGFYNVPVESLECLVGELKSQIQ